MVRKPHPPGLKEGPKAASRKPGPKQLEVIIKKNAGIVSAVARACDVHARTVGRWKAEDPKIQEMFSDAKNHVLDMAESKLVEAIGNGQAWAVCFYLKCQGKERGWNEKVALSGHVDHQMEIRSFVEMVDRVKSKSKEG